MDGGIFLGKPAPNWKTKAVVDGEIVELSSEQFAGKYLVMLFYPMDFTFVCPTELISFSDRIEEFLKVNCEVIACSTDSEYCHLAWVDTPRKKGGVGTLNIPLLSDITKKISKNYGILDEEAGVALRGLFIIDGKGLLRHICIHDNGVGRSVDETLRVINAIHFTEKFGEVCPANWKPGQDTVGHESMTATVLVRKCYHTRQIPNIMECVRCSGQIKPNRKGSVRYFEEADT